MSNSRGDWRIDAARVAERVSRSTIARVAVVHQPHFLPWAGYFNKLANADVFVVMDDVQYRKEYFQNRTLIKSHNGTAIWLTVPVKYLSTGLISSATPVSTKWFRKIIRVIQGHYSKAPHFEETFSRVADALSHAPLQLYLLNTHLLEFVMRMLEIPVPQILYSSNAVDRPKETTSGLIYLCEYFGVNTIIFGEGASTT